jgi:hypothetical protein
MLNNVKIDTNILKLGFKLGEGWFEERRSP